MRVARYPAVPLSISKPNVSGTRANKRHAQNKLVMTLGCFILFHKSVWWHTKIGLTFTLPGKLLVAKERESERVGVRLAEIKLSMSQ